MSELMDVQECFSVIFHNVREYYPPDCIINCQFSVKENNVINEPANCYVGIFVVAWDSLDNAIVKKSFTSMEMVTNVGIYDLNFDPKEILMPNFEEDEFYQFCFYNIASKDVFGASCPFQICDLKEGSLVHIDVLNMSSEDMVVPTFVTTYGDEVSWMLKESYKPVDEELEDKDTVLIHNKTTLMENALANAAKERDEALMASKEKFENELKQFSSKKEEIIEKNEAEVDHLKQLNHSLTERETLLKQNLLDSQNVVKQMENIAAENTKKTETLLRNLTVEKEALTKALADKEVESLDHINKIKTDLNAKIEATEITCDKLNKSLIEEKAGVERMQLKYEENVSNLKKEIELLGMKETESVHQTSKTLEQLQTKLNTEIGQKYEYLTEIDRLTQAVEKFQEEAKVKDSLVITEREKLAALTLQQEEMTSRLSLENKKICTEIQNLKSREKSLVEAHQKELLCHRNRTDEMESIFKEENVNLRSEIDQLNNELNDKINCINLLEAKLRESHENSLQMDTLKKENLKLSDTVDELKSQLEHLESDDSKKNIYTNSETGSMHALHVAYAHMQKQVNNLKKEKEIHCQQKSFDDMTDLERENAEFRLRLSMGRKAFDKQYMECQRLRNELTKLKMSASSISNDDEDLTMQETDNNDGYNALPVEYNNLKAMHDIGVDKLLADLKNTNDQKECCEKELVRVTEEKDNAVKLNEELREKLIRLSDDYEGKINRLNEEIGMLKTQRVALAQAVNISHAELKASSPDIVQTAASVTCAQPNLIQMNPVVIPKTERKNKEEFPAYPRNSVVSRQPDLNKPTVVTRPAAHAEVVQKQPLMANIIYPPSMVQGLAYPNHPQEIPRQARVEIAMPVPVSDPLIRAEPPSQIIPNRASITEQPPPNCRGESTGRGRAESTGRGRAESPAPIVLDPALQCPICALDFPANLTDGAKTEHVNSHFDH